MEKMYIPPAIDGSWDSLMHKLTNSRNSLLIFRGDNANKTETERLLLTEETRGKRDQRAIGVVYNPQYERYGNYVPTILSRRYDGFLYIDETHALHPLHMPEVKEDKELPETFPTGL
jgi:erythromycin esterase-like protein